MSLGRRVPTTLASNTDALVPETLPSFSGNLLLSSGPQVHHIYYSTSFIVTFFNFF